MNLYYVYVLDQVAKNHQKLYFTNKPTLEEAIAHATNVSNTRAKFPDANEDDFVAIAGLNALKAAGENIAYGGTGRQVIGKYLVLKGRLPLCELS